MFNNKPEKATTKQIKKLVHEMEKGICQAYAGRTPETLKQTMEIISPAIVELRRLRGILEVREIQKTQTDSAMVLGQRAFVAGKKRAPIFDPALKQLVEANQFKTSTHILEAWLKGWDNANLSGDRQ